MNEDWAAEHLQIIRTLMERSTLYRRALAPVMLVSGGVGVAAAFLPQWVSIESNRGFALYWMVVSVVALTASLLLVRRQALKAAEPFWSPPTRRVSQAVLPAFLVALLAGVFNVVNETPWRACHLAQLWVIVYGCALHAPGFFTPRGIRVFGWQIGRAHV